MEYLYEKRDLLIKMLVGDMNDYDDMSIKSIKIDYSVNEITYDLSKSIVHLIDQIKL